MKILWVSWKDWKHPAAGGAEVVLYELAKRQIADGHKVTILTARYPGSNTSDIWEGITIIRLNGNRYVQPFVTLPYYIRHLRNKYDVVIEVVNTAPYFTPFFRGRAQSVLFYHMLARQIWFYEAPLPVALIGFLLLEPVATFLLGKSGADTIVVSDSTKQDLRRFGFPEKRMQIVSEGVQLTPLSKLSSVKKYRHPTVLAHGAMRAMKRTIHQIQAFELAKQQIPDLQLKVSGSSTGTYGQKVLRYIDKSPYRSDIEYLGRTTDAQKKALMQRCHLHIQTATKEGWGITVTEANGQGTPCVVYDVDGLRDSVRHKQTGIITDPNPQAMADGIIELLHNPKTYNDMRQAAWEWSKTITFDQCYQDTKHTINAHG